ncbi:MAG: tetratricopeptide repeat protein [Treponema sp.]|uniref:tetratricopeptide repeat protein n=1 Tax=Treponema sp. TaxID=166 RepID=UPI00298E6933|nr:tetratricopeptide repeat protein [Treponema sp.]MCR5385880.1 tetratricopeptide repeat protein [Treponema sp.]
MADNDLLRSRADAAVVSRDFALAARLYSTLLQQIPDSIDLLEKLGNVYVKSGNDAKALPIFLQINEKKPDDYSTLTSLGGIYRRLKKYDESINVLQKALKLNKGTAQVYYNLGFTYKFMEKYDEAVDCFETVIQLNPTDVLAYNHLGAIYQKRGETHSAIQTYLKGLKVDCNHPVLHLNLAKSYEKNNEIKNAIAEYNAALRSKPGWHDALSDYSKLLLKLNRTKEAKELVDQALIINPRDVKMYALKGNILMNQCDYFDAGEEFKKALSFDPQYKKALIGLANAMEECGNASHAVEYIERAEKLDPESADILKQAVYIMLSGNRTAAASTKINKLFSIDKEDVETLDLAGQYFLVKKEENKAFGFYNKIKQLDPDYHKYLANASKRYKQNGDLTSAINYIKQYIDVEPLDSKQLTNYALLLLSIDQVDSAIENFRKAFNADKNNALAKVYLDKLSERLNETKTEEENAENADASEEVESAAEEELSENTETEEEKTSDDSLIDEDASSTDSDLWKSESWDPDKMVDENQDPFAELDGDDDESIFTGSNTVPAEDDAEPEEDKEELKDEPAIRDEDPFDNKINPGLTPDSLADPEADAMSEDALAGDGLADDGLTAESLAEEEPDDLFGDMPADTSVQSEPESSIPPMSEAPIDSGELDEFPSDVGSYEEPYEMPYEKPRASEPPRFKSHYDPDFTSQPYPYQEQGSGLSANDTRRLMDSMMKAQDEANRASDAAQKAWDAATKAADAAQIARETENYLNEKAIDAVNEAAEKVRASTEEMAKDIAEKALAERMGMIDDILPKFEKMLDQKNELPDSNSEEIQKALQLFKSLRALGESLPEESRHSFLQSKNRMRMDYIIGRLSGNKGLLKTSQGLRDSGKFTKFVREEEVPLSYKGKRLAFDVLNNVKDLTKYLNDADLSYGLEKIISNVVKGF